MRRYTAVAALVGLALVGCGDDETNPADVVTLNAIMTGAAEIPGPGDADAAGTAVITLNDDSNEVCWQISVTNITLPAIAAHIHPGATGVAGNPLVSLSAPDAGGASSGCVDADDSVVDDIIANPGQFYVNVHTTDFTGGALRGQLTN
jgi:hypothetical protein